MNPGVRFLGIADAVPEAAGALAGELDVPVRAVEQLIQDEHRRYRHMLVYGYPRRLNRSSGVGRQGRFL
ncbi:hypothetical protein AGR8A_pTi20144 [Agrobacterium fabrum str. J-07]|nr:hypothetical protein AGR8A_pTi20144 [Agrobacterium fabrum str. J-07]